MFGGRRPLRPILGTQATAQVMIEVRTEDELRRALTPKDTTTTAALVANTGRRIVIAAPITLKSSIIIDASLPGTVIESHGAVPIYPGVDGMDAFVIRAPLVSIRGLLLYADAGRSFGWGRAFVLQNGTVVAGQLVDPVKANISQIHLVGGDQLLVDETGNDASDGVLAECVVEQFDGVPNVDCVSINSVGWRIHHNILKASGTGVVIRVGTSGEKTAITGNDLNGQEVHTSASLGSNFIVGTTDDGTLTTHATDIVLQTMPGGGGGGTFGQTTATFTVNTDSVTVTVVDAGVSAGSNIVASVATAPGRDADEMERAPIVVSVASVTAGVGFDLLVVSLDGDADGAYLINYTRD